MAGVVTTYEGPVRHESLAVELHNTIFVRAGESVDGLGAVASVAAWLDAVHDRLPLLPPGPNPPPESLIELRRAVRDAFAKVFEGRFPTSDTLRKINEYSSRARYAPHARWRRGGPPEAITDYDGASREDIILATIAADAVDLLTGPRRLDLRRCGAPGCVLAFVLDHRRREWCSVGCGNRARQARHYHRHKARRTAT